MKNIFTLILFVVAASPVFSQGFPGAPGAVTVVSTVSTIGRNIYRAKEIQEDNREREEAEQNYGRILAQADTLFIRRDYEKAIEQYQLALSVKQEQYPRDQIARANVEIARRDRQAYQLTIDKADSLFRELNYPEAVTCYNNALTQKSEQYPKDQIAKANKEMERLKKVHFSGLLISDARVDGISSKAYADDPFSDFLLPGKYALTDNTLIYASFQTLDGIAIPAGVRLIMYSEPNLKGNVLLDVTGPAIVNNSAHQQEAAFADAHSKVFNPGLQALFPVEVRTWSGSDMQNWVSGSFEIIAIH